ncbi:hypothetical protein PYW08_002020 [Mythimna loreyi]|uniref:Uncharacterized protein n=1 Tax=Mythimna loreyi TaxID=667449 RepID=A0ACC2R3A6_9NEOP|nr:hypothetical protein PYW08_002020 [Mythimna loreyi]
MFQGRGMLNFIITEVSYTHSTKIVPALFVKCLSFRIYISNVVQKKKINVKLFFFACVSKDSIKFVLTSIITWIQKIWMNCARSVRKEKGVSALALTPFSFGATRFFLPFCSLGQNGRKKRVAPTRNKMEQEKKMMIIIT